MTPQDRHYLRQGYAPPAGIGWPEIDKRRAQWNIPDDLVPVGISEGGTWQWDLPRVGGVPLKPLATVTPPSTGRMLSIVGCSGDVSIWTYRDDLVVIEIDDIAGVAAAHLSRAQAEAVCRAILTV
jgi:hypothetical protein